MILISRRLCALATILLTTTHGAVAFDTSRIDDPEVRACADRALPTSTAQQIQKVAVTGKDGYVRHSRREMFWKRSEGNDSRILVRVIEPVEDKGVAVLVNDDANRNRVSYMTYSPKIKRVRKVTGESFFGTMLATDFTYDDFAYFYRIDDREEVTRRDDVVLGDFPMYVMEAVKPGENTQYSLVRFYIDQAVCLPMRTEFYALNGELRKELVADREHVQQHGERWVPHQVTMRDLKLGTSSYFEVEEIDLEPELHDAMFEVSALKRGGH